MLVTEIYIDLMQQNLWENFNVSQRARKMDFYVFINMHDRSSHELTDSIKDFLSHVNILLLKFDANAC